MRAGKIAVLVLLAAQCLIAPGCDTYSTELRYEGTVSERRLPNAIRVHIISFDDKRMDKRIGVALNMFDNVVTNYITGADIGAWISKALARELASMGYDPVILASDAERPPSPDAIVIDGQVLAFKCLQSTSLSVNSSVVIRANIKCGEEPVYSRYYYGSQEFILNNWIGTPDQFSKCSEKALQALMAQMVPALDARIKTHAGLAPAPETADDGPVAAPPIQVQ
ncbi:MAG TPA: hypothetical protein PL033_06340 [Candidatus Brocadiia bacterium]|nr:hypothetical protein [Candidatus Brocadiia bacterium]